MDHDGHQVLELGGLGAPAIDGLDDGGQSGVHLDDQVDVPAVRQLFEIEKHTGCQKPCRYQEYRTVCIRMSPSYLTLKHN